MARTNAIHHPPLTALPAPANPPQQPKTVSSETVAAYLKKAQEAAASAKTYLLQAKKIDTLS